MTQHGLKALLERHEITQRELAEALDKHPAAVTRLLSGETEPGQETIDAILVFLAKRTGRRMTYEQVFGSRPRVPA